jgi:hypothetical protein
LVLHGSRGARAASGACAVAVTRCWLLASCSFLAACGAAGL